jgi:hypothetical protein
MKPKKRRLLPPPCGDWTNSIREKKINNNIKKNINVTNYL